MYRHRHKTNVKCLKKRKKKKTCLLSVGDGRLTCSEGQISVFRPDVMEASTSHSELELFEAAHRGGDRPDGMRRVVGGSHFSP